MTRNTEQKPTTVPFPAKQVGETESRWGWAEPCVWTDRLLTTLEHGVKGGKWFGLIDKVYRDQNLLMAFRKVAANGGAAGVDHVSSERFEERLIPNLRKLSEQLRDGTCRPQAIRRQGIPQPGSKELRPWGIPTVRDRTTPRAVPVQTALRNVLEPIFEKALFQIEDRAEQSYGFRPKRGCKDALARVDELLKNGYTHVVDADWKGYFATIPHERLRALIQNKISDSPARPVCHTAGITNSKLINEPLPRRSVFWAVGTQKSWLRRENVKKPPNFDTPWRAPKYV